MGRMCRLFFISMLFDEIMIVGIVCSGGWNNEEFVNSDFFVVIIKKGCVDRCVRLLNVFFVDEV